MLTDTAKDVILNPSLKQQKRELAAKNTNVLMRKLLFFKVLVKPLDKQREVER